MLSLHVNMLSHLFYCFICFDRFSKISISFLCATSSMFLSCSNDSILTACSLFSTDNLGISSNWSRRLPWMRSCFCIVSLLKIPFLVLMDKDMLQSSEEPDCWVLRLRAGKEVSWLWLEANRFFVQIGKARRFYRLVGSEEKEGSTVGRKRGGKWMD